jgi:hypothetical protein
MNTYGRANFKNRGTKHTQPPQIAPVTVQQPYNNQFDFDQYYFYNTISS